jgi:hypothetical protein
MNTCIPAQATTVQKATGFVLHCGGFMHVALWVFHKKCRDMGEWNKENLKQGKGNE